MNKVLETAQSIVSGELSSEEILNLFIYHYDSKHYCYVRKFDMPVMSMDWNWQNLEDCKQLAMAVVTGCDAWSVGRYLEVNSCGNTATISTGYGRGTRTHRGHFRDCKAAQDQPGLALLMAAYLSMYKHEGD